MNSTSRKFPQEMTQIQTRIYAHFIMSELSVTGPPTVGTHLGQLLELR